MSIFITVGKGLQGLDGADGDIGPQGPQGIQGIQGPQGVKGDQGDIGLTGPQGTQGIQGVKGDDGDIGPQGPIGLTGPQGIQGIQGIKGDQGDVGPQGVKGDDGDAGSQGIQGVKGDDGDEGPQGPQGIQGPIGLTGAKGDKGDTGDTGPQGIQGPIGLTGPEGPQGDEGPEGPQGPAGAVDNVSFNALLDKPSTYPPSTHTHPQSEVTGLSTFVTDTNTHIARTDNPHSTTKAHVGLSAVPNVDATDRANHTGTQSADTLTDGTTNKAFLASERTKLSGIATGATANSSDATLLNRANHTGVQAISTVTSLQTTLDAKVPTTRTINSQALSADVTLTQDNVASGATNKVYTVTEQSKLAGIASGATANATDATLLARANHTGTQSADTLTDGTTNKAFLATERTKLSGVATGATANSTDATLLARANHTGTQSADTIVAGSTNNVFTTTEKTKLSGVATSADVTSATNVGSSIFGATAKTTPVDADVMPLNDSAASNVLKKVTWANIKATLKTYTDTLYATITHTHAQSDITNLTTDLAAKVPTTRTINSQALSANVTLTQDNIASGTTNKVFTATQETKLAGIATGATANSTDATLLARANHTGSQAISTITNLQTSLDSKSDTSHTHVAANVTDFSTAADARITAQKGAANGLATLGADSKLSTSQLPSIVLTDVYSVASQVAQLALTAQEGDIAIRTDLNRTYVHNGGATATMADWSELVSPTAAVSSVNSQIGAVVLTKTDVGLSNVPNTDATARANHTGAQAISTITDLQTTLDGKAASSHAHAQSDITNLTTDLANKVPTSRTINTLALSANITLTQDNIGDGTTNKAFLATERTKLTGIATGATANSADAVLLSRTNHTGTQSADTLTDGTTNKAFLATERSKLAGIANSATANSSDATLLARANHTGTQPIGSITATGTPSSSTYLRGDSTWASIVAGVSSVNTLTGAVTLTQDNVGSGTTNKVFTATEQTKLAGIAAGATVNSADATLLARANHTGTQSADTLTDGSTNRLYSSAEKTKLSGIATGATANSADATLLARANHTGTQPISTLATTGTASGSTYLRGDGAWAAAPADAVSSVNTQTGAVVLNQDNVGDGTTYKQYSLTEKNKLSGIASGATANSSDATLLSRANHTGTQSISTLATTGTPSGTTYLRGDGAWATVAAGGVTSVNTLTGAVSLTQDNIPDGTTNKAFTATEETKLAGIADGATANSSDATLLNRANHTGNQAISTISSLQATLDAKTGTTVQRTGTITFNVTSGNNILIGAGEKGDVLAGQSATITKWTLIADVATTAVVEVWKDTFANYPPTVADTITGSGTQRPTLTAARIAQSTTLTGWNVSVGLDDILRFNVVSNTAAKQLTLVLSYTRNMV